MRGEHGVHAPLQIAEGPAERGSRNDAHAHLVADGDRRRDPLGRERRRVARGLLDRFVRPTRLERVRRPESEAVDDDERWLRKPPEHSDQVERLLDDPTIVRNRLKVESTIANAQAIRALDGPLDSPLWSFVDGAPKVNRWRRLSDLPAETAESRAMSKELKRRGFRFVGPTVCYSLMQATGMVNDHVPSCFRWAEVQERD